MSNTTPLPIFVSFTMTAPGGACANYYGEPGQWCFQDVMLG